MAKPTLKPDWVVGQSGTNIVEPTSGKKAAGWVADERPAAEYWNWLLQNISEWIDYVDSVSDTLEAFHLFYQAVVGSGALATHTTLNAAMLDVAAGARILVISDQTLNVTQQITKNNVQIDVNPGVTFQKGTATLGVQVTADGVRWNGGRFAGFSTPGDKAMQIDNGSDYTMLRDIRFSNCDTEVSDLAATTSSSGHITE